jgi:hypothetical protein
MVDLRTLEVGAKLQLDTGATVEVVETSSDPRTVRARYVDTLSAAEKGDNFVHDIDADHIYGVYTDDTLTQVRSL